jgi:hypothetical protein
MNLSQSHERPGEPGVAGAGDPTRDATAVDGPTSLDGNVHPAGGSTLGMELTRDLVERRAGEYADGEALYAVEQQHVDILPGMVRDGEYGWRDVEWVVQWYYRRYLGAYPGDERRAREEAFGDNDFEDIRDTLAAVTEPGDVGERLRQLTSLQGVDVPVGSAFLQFLFPSRYVVVGGREWGALRGAGELDAPYPDPPTVEEYRTYHDVCRDLTERFDVDAWTLYRALWLLGADD